MTILLDEKPKVHVEEKKKPDADTEDKDISEDKKNSKEEKKEV